MGKFTCRYCFSTEAMEGDECESSPTKLHTPKTYHTPGGHEHDQQRHAGDDAASNQRVLWRAERYVGDVKDGPRLGTFYTNDETVARGLAAGQGRVERVNLTIRKPLVISASAEFDYFTGKEANQILKAAGIQYKFNEADYEGGEELWRMIDHGGKKLVSAVRRAGYDAIEFPETLQNKKQKTTLVF